MDVHLESVPSTILPPVNPSCSIMSGIEETRQLAIKTGQSSNNALGINAPLSPAAKPASPDSSVHYTCFIRLPFPRGDFVDPPQVISLETDSYRKATDHIKVDWNSTKDRALWKIISKASNSKELDCMCSFHNRYKT